MTPKESERKFADIERSLSYFTAEESWHKNYFYREWEIPDHQRDLIVSIIGGEEYGGRWMRDIRLMIKFKEVSPSRFLMMRAQAVLVPVGASDLLPVNYNVYLDTIDEDNHDHPSVGYYSAQGGRMGRVHSWWRSSHFYPSFLPRAEVERQYLERLKEEGAYSFRDLPAEIDTEATVAAFTYQLKKGDYSQPRLILKQELDFPSLRLTRLHK